MLTTDWSFQDETRCPQWVKSRSGSANADSGLPLKADIWTVRILLSARRHFAAMQDDVIAPWISDV